MDPGKMSLLLPCRVITWYSNWVIALCQQNFDTYDVWKKSWPMTGLPYSHLVAGLVLSDGGELAGCAPPARSSLTGRGATGDQSWVF